MAYFAPPGYQPQCNPIMPYLGPLSLRPGMSVYIHGVIPHHITRFEVDLQCGEFEGTDIALHFNPRFDGWDKVVFNTFRDGCWEGEERVREMPFRKGESFELIIIASAEGYQINVNGRQFYMFQHRVPLERVSALRIQGDVTLETLNIIGGGMQGFQSGGMGGMGGMGGGMQGYPSGGMGGMGGMGGDMQDYPSGGMGGMGGGMQGYPSGGMGGMGGMGGGMQVYPSGGMGGMGGMGQGGGMGYQGGNLPMMGGAPIYNPQIPYCDMIPGGMTAKRTIIIRGMVPYGANRFHLNFMVGGSRDVAFHLNPRIREGMVVRNSYMGGCWGNEESNLDCNPFQEGQYFEISVRCGNWRYKVFVNGQRLCEFAHRLQPFTQVDTLQVEGDVQLSYIHY